MAYKRFFAFGCSFSSWHWPTWADIVGREFADADYYNLGICASGNEYSFHRLTEAHAKYHITPDDLVVICWTNFAREDRWMNGRWITSGNIFTQDHYDKEFIKKYFSLKGALIKTSSVIAGATHLLNDIGCDYVFSSAFPMSRVDQYDIIYTDPSYDPIFKIYQPYYDKINISMTEYLYGRHQWQNPQAVKIKHWATDADWWDDDHPNVAQHLKYTQDILIPKFKRNFALSPATVEWAENWHRRTFESEYFLTETSEYNLQCRRKRFHQDLL